jgi:hypothetical protein
MKHLLCAVAVAAELAFMMPSEPQAASPQIDMTPLTNKADKTVQGANSPREAASAQASGSSEPAAASTAPPGRSPSPARHVRRARPRRPVRHAGHTHSAPADIARADAMTDWLSRQELMRVRSYGGPRPWAYPAPAYPPPWYPWH